MMKLLQACRYVPACVFGLMCKHKIIMTLCWSRSGAFECHPELITYKKDTPTRTSKKSTLFTDTDENQPPNISYVADTSAMHGYEDDSDSEEEDRLLRSSHSMDWENLNPSLAETKLFQEDQMKLALRLASTTCEDDASSEREVSEKSASTPHEHRVWRLDYDSTYADFSSLLASNVNASGGRKVQLSATSSVKLISSLEDENERQGKDSGGQPKESHQETEAAASAPTGGLFETLSSLWSSTFGGK